MHEYMHHRNGSMLSYVAKGRLSGQELSPFTSLLSVEIMSTSLFRPRQPRSLGYHRIHGSSWRRLHQVSGYGSEPLIGLPQNLYQSQEVERRVPMFGRRQPS